MALARTYRHERSRPCSTCGRTFSRRDGLIRHQRMHEAAKARNIFRLTGRRFRACQACRGARVRCSGAWPCEYCSSREIECQLETDQRRLSSDANTPEHNDECPPTVEVDQNSRLSSQSQLQAPSLPSPPGSPRNVSGGSVVLEHLDVPASTGGTENADSSFDAMQTAQTIASTPNLSGPTSFAHGSPTHTTISSIPASHDLSSSFLLPDGHGLQGYSPFTFMPMKQSAESIELAQPTLVPINTLIQTCRYPVLQPLARFFCSHIGIDVACKLLDVYFKSSYRHRLHPSCHHIHSFILRQKEVLDPRRPRTTAPALLASMLWTACYSDEASGLFTTDSVKDAISRDLGWLTFNLLQPQSLDSRMKLNHIGLSDSYRPPDSWIRAAGPLPVFASDETECQSLSLLWQTDQTIAYIHVASIISASEQKAASIGWWQAVFSLARRFRLHQELPDHDNSLNQTQACGCENSNNVTESRLVINEIHREERRRAWWLLFLMDRHLALCYNLHLRLSESECQNLLLPIDDLLWQQEEYQPHSHSVSPLGPACSTLSDELRRPCGPPLLATGVSLFQFYLPLMTITGHLLELYQAKTNPEVESHVLLPWIVLEGQIQEELENYQKSVDISVPSALMDLSCADEHPVASLASHQEPVLYAKTVHAYANYVVLVIRLLLCGKWDPVFIFEDTDFWTSSAEFKQSLAYTMSAADYVERILEYDPEVRFMPYFFGIQLLHGSWLLLLVTHRLKEDSGETVLKACETVIRGTEACLVTLRTEYQRHFRNIMRAAINLAQGRQVNDPAMVERQITAVLARYRWSRTGGGLARK